MLHDEIDLDYSERKGFMIGRTAALSDWSFRKSNEDFEELCRRLYMRNWARAARLRQPDRFKAASERWRAKHRVEANEKERARRAKKRQPCKVTCVECGKVVIRKRRARYCSASCRGRRIWNARSQAKNRGIRTMGLEPRILAAIATQPGLKLAALTIATGIKKGSLATKLTQLVRRGVVERGPGGAYVPAGVRPEPVRPLRNGLVRISTERTDGPPEPRRKP